MYDEPKIEKFQKSAINDYKAHIVVEDICKVKEVEKTDGTFTQIGIRPLIEDDIFIAPNFHPELPAVGMTVANGERDFLIKSIIDHSEIKPVEFKEEIKEFPKYAYDFNEATILISLDFFVGMSKLFMGRFEYKDYKTILDSRYRILFVPGDLMKNKIIIIDKDAILWEKQKFYNKYTKSDEKMDIRITPAKIGKVDIVLRSVNKIKYLDPTLIKVLEVKNETTSTNK
jgi:hypothetical protein